MQIITVSDISRIIMVECLWNMEEKILILDTDETGILKS